MELQTGDTMSTIHYHAGHNMPGYLPESDVYTCGTFDEAKSIVIDDLDRYGDYLFECDRKDEADETCALMQDLNLENAPIWHGYVGDLVYWIEPCHDGCDMEDF
jgi:hypothetical protein